MSSQCILFSPTLKKQAKFWVGQSKNLIQDFLIASLLILILIILPNPIQKRALNTQQTPQNTIVFKFQQNAL